MIQSMIGQNKHKNNKQHPQAAQDGQAVPNRHPAIKQHEGMFQFVSQIFEDNQNFDDDATIQVKNNILLVLLFLTIYSMYYLFNQYLDTIVLGFLSGVAYRQLRARFVDFWRKDKKKVRVMTGQVIFRTIVMFILFFLLPWIRYNSKQSTQTVDFSLMGVFNSFIKSKNIIVRVTQFYLLIQIIYNIFGNKLDSILSFNKISTALEQFIKIIFGIITFIVTVLFIILVVIVLANQLGRSTELTINAIQIYSDCQFKPTNQTTYYPLMTTKTPCSQKITGSFKNIIPKIQNTTALTECIKKYNQYEMTYIGYDVFDFQEHFCQFFVIVKEVSPNLIQSLNLKVTSQLLLGVFGTIWKIIIMLSDGLFAFSTFFGIFFMTVNYFQFTTDNLAIFGQKRQDLINQITTLISATIFITLQHLALSIVLFDILRFSDINIFLSIFLSLIAFVPYFKPIIIVVILGIFNILNTGEYITNIICMILYGIYSSKIFDTYYNDLSLHKTIINMSVVFGIYQFGVSGIFYGPLIILLFQFVRQELFRKK